MSAHIFQALMTFSQELRPPLSFSEEKCSEGILFRMEVKNYFNS